MKRSLLELIVCPISGSRLDLETVTSEDGGEVLEGTLCSQGEGQNLRYAITQGVPDLLAPLDGSRSRQTVGVFGNEWEHYNYWGWLKAVPDGMTELDVVGGMLTDAKRMFHHKTQFEGVTANAETIALDVGCGNGRHSFQALEAGHGNVVSLDASDAIYVARRNFLDRGIVHTHFVKGNARNLPLRGNCIDHAFSIGVMQHTGSAKEFLAEQSRVVKEGGDVSLNCYGTGTLFYEISDKLLRLVSTRLSLEGQKRFASRMASFGKWVWQDKEHGIRRFFADNLSVQPTDHHMFDWYSPKIADHYSPKELIKLFHELRLEPVAANHEIWRPDYDDGPRRQKHHAFCFHLKNGEALDAPLA